MVNPIHIPILSILDVIPHFHPLKIHWTSSCPKLPTQRSPCGSCRPHLGWTSGCCRSLPPAIRRIGWVHLGGPGTWTLGTLGGTIFRPKKSHKLLRFDLGTWGHGTGKKVINTYIYIYIPYIYILIILFCRDMTTTLCGSSQPGFQPAHRSFNCHIHSRHPTFTNTMALSWELLCWNVDLAAVSPMKNNVEPTSRCGLQQKQLTVRCHKAFNRESDSWHPAATGCPCDHQMELPNPWGYHKLLIIQFRYLEI